MQLQTGTEAARQRLRHLVSQVPGDRGFPIIPSVQRVRGFGTPESHRDEQPGRFGGDSPRLWDGYSICYEGLAEIGGPAIWLVEGVGSIFS